MASVQSLSYDSNILANNPLRDPAKRQIAIFESSNDAPLKKPLVVYLPGFGESSKEPLENPEPWQNVVDRLESAGISIVLAVVDGSNRFGSSQYLNSSATGRYMDYVCDEIVPFIERKFDCGGSASVRHISGYSSGGFGALRIGMARNRVFGGIVALAPDCGFDLTHKPFALDAATKALPLKEVQRMMSPGLAPVHAEGTALYSMALCAAYAPKSGVNGQFDWLYDSDGRLQPAVYEKWLANDPFVLVQKLPACFAPNVKVYLDGPAEDEFKTNIAVTKLGELLKARRIRHKVDIPAGGHGTDLQDRLERGLRWVAATG